MKPTRKLFLALALLILSAGATGLFAQSEPEIRIAQRTSSHTLIREELVAFLEKGGIIASTEAIQRLHDNRKRRAARGAEKKRNEFLGAFQAPMNLNIDFPVSGPGTNYASFPISVAGSYVFEERSMPATTEGLLRKQNVVAILPAYSDQKQLAIPKERLDHNSCKLHMNLSSLINFNMTAQAGGSDNQKIIQGAASTAIEQTFSKHESVSMAYGPFENKLAGIFRQTIDQGYLLNPRDFMPLFELWAHYANKQGFTGGFVISDFSALVVQKSVKNEFLGRKEIETSSELDLKAIPFVKLKTNAEFKWGKSKEIGINANSVDLYFHTQPNFQAIPGPAAIEKVWKYLLPPAERQILEADAQDRIYLDENGDFVVHVLVGPLPAQSYVRHMEASIVPDSALKERYLLKAEVFSTNAHPRDQIAEGYYYVPVKLQFDWNAMAASQALKDKLTFSPTIRVAFKQKAGGKELAREFKPTIVLPTGPRIERASEIAHSEDGEEQSWKLQLFTDREVAKLTVRNIVLPNVPGHEIRWTAPVRNTNNTHEWTIEGEANLLDPEVADYGKTSSLEVFISIEEDANSLTIPRKVTIRDAALAYQAEPEHPEVVFRENVPELEPFFPDSMQVLAGTALEEDYLNRENLDEAQTADLYEGMIEKGVIKTTGEGFMLRMEGTDQ